MDYYTQGLDGELLLCRTRWPRFSSNILYEIRGESDPYTSKSDPSPLPFTVVITKIFNVHEKKKPASLPGDAFTHRIASRTGV